MKRLVLIGVILVFGGVIAQAEEVTFKVEVSTDTVLMDNYFEVKFTIENARPGFSPPTFSDFDVVGGPNQSSSFSMINGKVTQSATYTYYLQPRMEGVFYIDAAAIEVDGDFIETPPVEVVVLPNPDGIIENPHQLRRMVPEEKKEKPVEKPSEPRRIIRL